ncbi:hypothetical protein PVAP13_9NG611128 [Panicum virgatum]|uniref:Uncharacterized protein n=1 Tax=Panicum virgatum TaxID=38727 RepID=A0A8T0N237_PANVG|nr:hypothetical protein PVAP13_9NG611128 [Panicum virgatum]
MVVGTELVNELTIGLSEVDLADLDSVICNVTVKHWNNLKRRRKIGCLVVARPQHPVQAQTDAQIRPHNPVLSPARAQIGRSRHPADVPISHLATLATATGGRRAPRPVASTERPHEQEARLRHEQRPVAGLSWPCRRGTSATRTATGYFWEYGGINTRSAPATGGQSPGQANGRPSRRTGPGPLPCRRNLSPQAGGSVPLAAVLLPSRQGCPSPPLLFDRYNKKPMPRVSDVNFNRS